MFNFVPAKTYDRETKAATDEAHRTGADSHICHIPPLCAARVHGCLPRGCYYICFVPAADALFDGEKEMEAMAERHADHCAYSFHHHHSGMDDCQLRNTQADGHPQRLHHD